MAHAKADNELTPAETETMKLLELMGDDPGYFWEQWDEPWDAPQGAALPLQAEPAAGQGRVEDELDDVDVVPDSQPDSDSDPSELGPTQE